MKYKKQDDRDYCTKTKVDENGRVCTGRCGEYLNWYNEDGTTNFTKSNQSTTGWSARCKACTNEVVEKNKKTGSMRFRACEGDSFGHSDTGYSLFPRRHSY